MANIKKPSKRIASEAGKELRKPSATKQEKSLAGRVLGEAKKNKTKSK